MNIQLRQTAEIGYIPDSAAVEISDLLSLAGVGNTPVGFSDLPQAQKNCLRRCAAHKANIDGYVRWISQTQNLHRGDAVFNPTKLNRIASCGSYLQFRQYHTLVPPKTVLTNSNACKQHAHCPLCALRRAAKMVRKYHEKCKILTDHNADLELFYLVLTIENEADFGGTFECVEKAIRGMFANRRDLRKARRGNKKNFYLFGEQAEKKGLGSFVDVTAGAYSIEVKRGSGSNKWHPHVNLLLLVEKPSKDDIEKGKWNLNYRKVRAEWNELTGGKGRNIEFRRKEEFTEDKQIFAEIFKYAMKFSEMAFGDRYQAATALYRRNLSGSFGDFRGINVDNDDNLEFEDLPYLELLYRYNAPLFMYVLDRIDSKIPFAQRAETFTPEGTETVIERAANALQKGGLCGEA